MSATPRLEFVDGLRAVAALAVVFIHVFYEPSLGDYSLKWMYWLGVSYNRVPVDIFIVLSGFCLMLPIARRDNSLVSWANWYRRRALRILPPYYAAVALSLFLTVLLILPVAEHLGSYVATLSIVSAWESMPTYLLQLQDVYGQVGQSINNPPLWSIAVELKVYLFMPLVLFSLRSWGNWITLAWTIAFGLGAQQVFGHFIGGASPWYVALFAMGAVAAVESVNGRVRGWWRIGSLGFVVLFGVLVALKKIAFYNDHLLYFGLIVGAATSLFLGATMRELAGGRSSWLTRILASKPLATVGVFSYSLYLVHNPLIRVTHLIIESFVQLSPEVMFVALLSATPLYVGAAYLFHLACERPFMRRV